VSHQIDQVILPQHGKLLDNPWVRKPIGVLLILISLWCFKRVFWGGSDVEGTWTAEANGRSNSMTFRSDWTVVIKDEGVKPRTWAWGRSKSDRADIRIEPSDRDEYVNLMADINRIPSFDFRLEDGKLYSPGGGPVFKRSGGFFGLLGSCFMFFVALFFLGLGMAALIPSKSTTAGATDTSKA
jgi:hypothetical protein